MLSFEELHDSTFRLPFNKFAELFFTNMTSGDDDA